MSYVIGLWFTLRTHAAVIWNTEIEEKKTQSTPLPPLHAQNGTIFSQPVHGLHNIPKQHSSSVGGGSVGRPAIRDSQLYKRILGQSLKQAGLSHRDLDEPRPSSTSGSAPHGQLPHSPYIFPPKSSGGDSTVVPDHSSQRSIHVAGLSEEDNNNLGFQVTEIAATAAAVAARDASRAPRKTSAISQMPARSPAPHFTPYHDDPEEIPAAEVVAHEVGGGHDAPNWSRLKSAIILLVATVLYAVIAEILVNTVDVVLESVDIDEKFLGITLFALVPNTTEFLVRSTELTSGYKTDMDAAERHLFCDEWEYSTIYGNRVGLRLTGVHASNSSARFIQRCAWAVSRSSRSIRSYLQVSYLN